LTGIPVGFFNTLDIQWI